MKLHTISALAGIGSLVSMMVIDPVIANTQEFVTVPLVNGMSITTGNSVANVEFRAKSISPGFCAIEISADEEVKSFIAPPLVWSSWRPLATHIGSASYILNYDVKCDTDALVEVRYYPK